MEIKQNIKNSNFGILFDLEGTIVKSIYQKKPNITKKLHIETKKIILEEGIPEEVIKKYDKSVLIRNAAIEWVEKNYSKKEVEKFKKKINVFLDKYDMRSAYSSELYADTIFILNYLVNKKYTIGIVTNTSRKAATYILKNNGIKKYIKIIITRDEVKKLKPDPEMIYLASKKMDRKIKCLIGDSIVDYDAGNSAGIQTIILNRNSKNNQIPCKIKISSLKQLQFYL